MSNSSGFDTDLLYFEGNHFVYNGYGCQGTSRGKGTFIIQHDTLLLRFGSLAAPAPLVLSRPKQPSTQLSVQVVEENSNEPILGASVYITPTLTGAKPLGTSTTNTGQAQLNYTPSATDTLVVAFVGYAIQRIPLASLGGKCLRISMGHTDYVEAGTTYRYPLERLHRASFTAHLSNDEQFSYAHLRYKRISASKAKAILNAREQN